MINTIDAMHKMLEFDFQQGDFTFYINKLSKSVKLCISTEDSCVHIPYPTDITATATSPCDMYACIAELDESCMSGYCCGIVIT